MSSIEFQCVRLGHYRENREYNALYERMETVYEWIGGCGPSGEIGIEARIANVSNKEIDSVTLVCEPLDISGDVVGKEMELQFTTISRYDEEDRESEIIARIWNAPTAKEVNIKNVQVFYSDGSEEIINGKDVKFACDNDSVWAKIEAEKAKNKEEKAQRAVIAKKEKEDQEENSRKSRGIIAYAGKVDGEDYRGEKCKIVTVGDVVFYIQESNCRSSYDKTQLIGWESKEVITHMELPLKVEDVKEDCLKNTSIKSVMFPRTKKSISYRTYSQDNLNIYKVEKIVIPKETKNFSAEAKYLSSIEEIEFEDPCGWGVSKKIITDPKKMYEYIFEKDAVYLDKSNSIIRKILYKLGF